MFLGRFEPIFHFHFEHVLFGYIFKQNEKSRLFQKNLVDFQQFLKRILLEANFGKFDHP